MAKAAESKTRAKRLAAASGTDLGRGNLIFIGVSVVWPLALLVLIGSREGFTVLANSTPELAAVIAAMSMPLVLLWLLVSIFYRKDAEQSAPPLTLEASDSETTDAQLTRSAQNLAHHSSELTRASIDAVERIRDADELLRQRAKQLWQASDGARERSESISESLLHSTRELAESMDLITSKSTLVDASLKNQTQELDALIDQAKERAATVVDAFRERLSDIGVVADEANDEARQRALVLRQQMEGHIEEITNDFFRMGDAVKQRLKESAAELSSEISAADLQGKQLAEELQTTFHQLGERISEHLKNTTTDLNSEITATEQRGRQLAGDLKQAFLDVDDTARGLSEGVSGDLINLIQEANTATAEMGGNLETARAVLAAAREDLDQLSAPLNETADRITGAAKQIADQQDLLQSNAGELGGAAENVVRQMESQTTTIMGARDLLDQQIHDFAEKSNALTKVLQNSGDDFDERTQSLREMLGRMTESMRVSGEDASRFAASLRTGLSNVEEQGERVAGIINGTLEQLTQAGEILGQRTQDVEIKSVTLEQLLTTANTQLAATSEALEKGAMLAKSEANALSDIFSHHTAMMDDASREALRHSEVLGNTLTEKTKSLQDMVAAIGAQVLRMPGLVDHEELGLRQAVETLAAEINGLGANLTREAAALAEATLQSREYFDDIAGKLKQGRDEVMQAGDIAVSIYDRVNGALVKNSGLLRDSALEASELVDEIDLLSTNLSARVKDLSSGLDDRISNIGTIEKSFNESIVRISQTAEAGAERVQGAGSKLVGDFERIDEMSRKAQATIGESTGQLEVYLGGLEHTSEAVATRLTGSVDGLRTEMSQFSEQISTMVAEVEGLSGSLRSGSGDIENMSKQTGAHITHLTKAMHRQTRELLQASEEASRQTEEVYAKNAAARRITFMRDLTAITESLNSLSIDITRAIERNVPDDAWNKYLDGDRSIFTRGLLKRTDNFSLIAIKNHYQDDQEFRDHVNRYLAQFEEALEQSEATDPEDVVSAALLSSDVGKLYLLISRALGRLR